MRNFREMNIWNQGISLTVEAYRLVKKFPKEEEYGLKSQIRRASVSIPSNIAEGHSRSGTKDFIQFISIAIGSLAEVETQILLSQDLKYAAESEILPLLENVSELQRMLHALRTSLKAKL